jgi:hypothetical protein
MTQTESEPAQTTSEPVLEEAGKPKDELVTALGLLISKYEWVYKSKAKTASLAKLLTSTVCERQLDYALRNPEYEDKRFDSFYREKSEYSTVKILDHLKGRLAEEGIKACIATEVKDENGFGVYDVTIVKGNPCLILQGGQEKIKIEIKASFGLPLEQVERYLWDPSPLILVRVLAGQVVLLKRPDLKEFVQFSNRLVLEKAKRLAEGKSVTVSGLYCSGCPDLACPHNRGAKRPSNGVIKSNDSDFGEDLSSLFRNLPFVAEKTSELVIRELKRGEHSVTEERRVG